MSDAKRRTQIAVAQRVAVAGVREATKNVGKQVVKAHLRAGGKVVSSYLRVAPRGAARFIPGGIWLTISVLDAAYSMYSLYGAMKDAPVDDQQPQAEDDADEPDDNPPEEPVVDDIITPQAVIPPIAAISQNIKDELPDLFR